MSALSPKTSCQLTRFLRYQLEVDSIFGFLEMDTTPGMRTTTYFTVCAS
jgi:hypothetical protein